MYIGEQLLSTEQEYNGILKRMWIKKKAKELSNVLVI